MNIRLLYKIAQILENPTPEADDSIPGDLPSSPNYISFTPSSKKLIPGEIFRNMLSHSRNIPIIERHPTGEEFYS